MSAGAFSTIVAIIILMVETAGIVAALHAVLTARSSQSAIAWAISLVTFPWIALILYIIFGRNKFKGYISLRQTSRNATNHLLEGLYGAAADSDLIHPASTAMERTFSRLARMPITRCNQCRLLINGNATFQAIFDSIDKAEHYILVQFYIVRDDRLGQELKDRLVQKATSGVGVYFLYDEIGSHELPRIYLRELRAAGVAVSEFHSTKGRANRFQVNFRNHRKIVVVDGEVGFIGGHNVGEEFISRHPKHGAWRDTHVEVHGPAVIGLQFVFSEDWHWATDTTPSLQWHLRYHPDAGESVLVLPSGPADNIETCGLMFVEAINAAKDRIWLATPYFIPDERILGALKLAVLRGVEVRILLPEKPDHFWMGLASYARYDQLLPLQIQIYRYTGGFMHHKVFLVDDEVAAVGTANLDNRSFRLNFEITLLNFHPPFIQSVRQMLEADFVRSRLETMADYSERILPFRIAVKAVSLLEPIL